MSEEKIGIGVVGYGYWGPNLVRNFNACPGAAMRMVADARPERRAAAEAQFPSVRAVADVGALLAAPDVAAVAIATPTDTHFELARAALEAGKHVLVEKPITDDAARAEALVALADEKGLTLQVDHTFIYTPAVRLMKEMVAAGELGDVLYYDSTRINLGLFQRDVDVIWDLAVHDLSILFYLIDERPISVSATGVRHFQGEQVNVAFLTLHFASAKIAHINVNWLAPVKIRRTIVAGDAKMIVYDDLEPSDKIKVYDKGVTFTDDPAQMERLRVGYRVGDMRAPALPGAEALSVEAAHFVDCVRTGRQPDTPGRMGLEIVRVLEAASRSIDLGGAPVEL